MAVLGERIIPDRKTVDLLTLELYVVELNVRYVCMMDS